MPAEPPFGFRPRIYSRQTCQRSVVRPEMIGDAVDMLPNPARKKPLLLASFAVIRDRVRFCREPPFMLGR